MSFINRADGVHFVIPSYRDMITMRSTSGFKKEIQALSNSYGEYITLQQKGPVQFEVAFAPDTGYLLGESIWHHFKRPLDLIYCEAIPNTTEAILVIVQSGSVYLDGSFQIDSIAEELIIFLTQRNNFDIYTYGDVPISQTPEEGKFSFEPSSVRSFTMLDKAVFPTLPLIKSYQLQLVETVLQEHNIGVLPVKKMVIGGVIVVLLWLMWTFMTAPKEAVTQIIISQVNPYQAYNDALTSPAPEKQLNQFLGKVSTLFALPGWAIKQVTFSGSSIIASVNSKGSNIQTLQNWAQQNGAQVDLGAKGVNLTMTMTSPNRSVPTKIYPLKQVITNFLDTLALVYPGDHIKFGGFKPVGVYQQSSVEITIDNLSPVAIGLIGESFEGLPFILKSVTLKTDKDGLLSGKISLDAVGS